MGICDISGDSVTFVVLTYLIALLPWSVISFWDPINREWKSYWQLRYRSWLYLLVSILPYVLLVPYAIVQGCSKDDDTKELLTAIVAMFASLWNLRRAVRGLCALQEIRHIWENVDIREVALCYADWLPRKKGTIWDGNLEKLSVVDVQISHSLVDNDWPGEAPQTPYIRKFCYACRAHKEHDYFPEVRVESSEEVEKQCILTLWCLWMVHGSDDRSKGQSLKVEWEDKWMRSLVKGFRRAEKQMDYPDKAASAGTAITLAPIPASEVLKREWACPDCNNVPFSARQKYVCAWCVLRPLITRAWGVFHTTDRQENSPLYELELRNQLSNLPRRVQGEFKLLDEARILHLYKYHYKLDKDNLEMARCEGLEVNTEPKCPASRMGFILGLSKQYDGTVKRWLRTSTREGNDIRTARLGAERPRVSRDTMNKKYISFVVLLAAQGEQYDPFSYLDKLPKNTTQPWPLEKHLHSLGRIVRTIGILLLSGDDPLDVLQGRRQKRWNALLSSVLGSTWGANSNRSGWNEAIRNEFRLLSRMLPEKAISVQRDRFRFLPSVVAYSFQEIKKDPADFYSRGPPRDYTSKEVTPEDWCIRTNRDFWGNSNNEKMEEDSVNPLLSLTANFKDKNQHGVKRLWKVGLLFCFPCWVMERWPEAELDIKFVISVYAMEGRTESLMFQTEALNVFHFSHFTAARPWSGEQKRSLPLDTLHTLYDDGVAWDLTIGEEDLHDHSSWRLLECWGIPTSSAGLSRIGLSLHTKEGRAPRHDEVVIHSFWVTRQTEQEITPQDSWHVLSAMERCGVT